MRLPPPAAWPPRLIAALLRGSLPFISSGRPPGETSAPEGFIPWRGDSFVSREPGPTAARAAVEPRPLTYAPERSVEPAPATRPPRPLEGSIFPWEELARIRGSSRPDPARADAVAPEPRTSADLAMGASLVPPGRGEPNVVLLGTPALSPNPAALGARITPVRHRRQAHELRAAGPGPGAAWKWMFWIAILAFVLYQL